MRLEFEATTENPPKCYDWQVQGDSQMVRCQHQLEENSSTSRQMLFIVTGVVGCIKERFALYD